MCAPNNFKNFKNENIYQRGFEWEGIAYLKILN